ncbi:MAG: tetratricopeptide repeat protein [Clostridia bacterium]|nr:tetratricopeptide repeat protein [Clostridia bacterium]
MATFLYKTRGNASPEHKPRVYFTCHPEDFSKYFEKICEDIFRTNDCVVFYTENMNEEIEEKYKESDLGQMNLFVIPVTFKLLKEINRAMDSDFRYAKEKNIPVLPVMMETGLDALYSLQDKFGELQYLSPYSKDITAISYAEKLKKYLDSVLVSNETAQRIRKAFDAYIFLSYRKKDRHYANELMKRIHNHPEFRDIAVWYDEFLTPGESFRENIEKMMKDSKLFTLLVTPNLLEYVNGKPNYVMEHEYPDAKAAGMNILPTEMEETDKTELCSKYKDIPDCVNPNEDAIFKERILDSLSKIAVSANNSDPEHNFLIGLAYLDGIDVEMNKERGVELIISSAETGLPEAMKKLYVMYGEGIGVQVNYKKAVFWAEKIVEYNINRYGAENFHTLTSLNNLAVTYSKLGENVKAAEILENVYLIDCKIFGEEHQDTLTVLNNLAVIYGRLGDHQKALTFFETVYARSAGIPYEEYLGRLTMINNLAHAYGKLGNYEKAVELFEKVYDFQCKFLGEEHDDTLTTLSNLAGMYGERGESQKAMEVFEKVYAIRRRIFGEEHPNTLAVLGNLAGMYGDIGKTERALELYEYVYAKHCEILGEEHPDTLTTLNNLAYHYGNVGNHEKSLELSKNVYAIRKRILGENHPDTLTTFSNLAGIYYTLGNCQKAVEIFEQVLLLQCRVLPNERHPEILRTLGNLAYTYRALGNYRKALESFEKIYTVKSEYMGAEHPESLVALSDLAQTYDAMGEYQKALALNEKICEIQCRNSNGEDPETLKIMNNLASSYYRIGNCIKATELFEKIYMIQCKVLGEGYRDTIITMNNLALAYGEIGEYVKAMELFEKFEKIIANSQLDAEK